MTGHHQRPNVQARPVPIHRADTSAGGHQVTAQLCVDVPAVDEEVRVLVVRCGQSTAEVKEHGYSGSGDWAVWINGHVIGDGGTRGYPRSRAVADARAHVQREETRRLLHDALRERLDATPQTPRTGEG